MPRLPVVAVIGRPNVGKSTLVNRVVGGRPAVVEETPGVTRDRRDFTADWAGRSFVVVDTGGWELSPEEPISTEIRAQAEAAMASADVVVFVTDASTGITDDDAGVAEVLRRADVPVVLVANKVDHPLGRGLTDQMWGLGLGEPLPVSAFHGLGTGDLLDRVVAALPVGPEPGADGRLSSLAIVGRPNVGKSTLLNRLVGEERVIVSDRPGTTRDPIDVVVEIGGVSYRVVDTAGMRRRSQIGEEADFYSVLRAERVVAEADVALLVLDASDGVTHQDQRIAGAVAQAGAGLVVLLNKWDLVDDEQRPRVEADLADRLGFVGWAPVLRVSALSGARLGRLPEAVETAVASRRNRIPTGTLNRLLSEWTSAHPPPVRKGRRPKVRYGVQAGVEPPTFVMFVSGGELGPDYLRFLESRIRRYADFTGSPVHVVARGGERRR